MAFQNKIFATGNLTNSHHYSKTRTNREYLLSDSVAKEFNTYNYFGLFNSFNDVYEAQYDEKGNQKTNPTYKGNNHGPGTPGVRSLFSKHGSVLIGISQAVNANDLDWKASRKYIYNASEFRISNNVPLLDTPLNRKKIRKHSGCSVKELVQYSRAGQLGRAIYDYSDFMYCKHLGKIPNNYLITLRRFPIPVGDFISGLGEGKTRTKEGRNRNPQQIGCMVTWLGASGNEMGNILKYTVKMPYKEMDAQYNDVNHGDADAAKGPLNSIAAMFDPTYRQQFNSGYGGAALSPFMSKFFGSGIAKKVLGPIGADGDGTGPYNIAEQLNWKDDNKAYGPIDRVKKTYIRSDEGLTFDQEITINFDYELRHYNGINGRQAMLDLLSNILNVTYSTGGFWGGGYRSGGMHQNSIFSNLNIFKVKGGFTSFCDAFAEDYSNVTQSIRSKMEAEGVDFTSLEGLKNAGKMLLSALNNIGGMLLGGLLNNLGRPQKVFANSLLSEAPVGFWHLTVGNPHHPIISVGNMVLTNTTIEHYGPLGIDDFPTGIKVSCTLQRGKPRDIREIEKMYMHGNDRIYHGMTKKVADMYKHADDYRKSMASSADASVGESDPNKTKLASSNKQINVTQDEIVTEEASITKVNGELVTNKINPISNDDLKQLTEVFRRYYGEQDSYSIYIPAGEQEYGAFKKSKTSNPTSSGSAENPTQNITA